MLCHLERFILVTEKKTLKLLDSKLYLRISVACPLFTTRMRLFIKWLSQLMQKITSHICQLIPAVVVAHANPNSLHLTSTGK